MRNAIRFPRQWARSSLIFVLPFVALLLPLSLRTTPTAEGLGSTAWASSQLGTTFDLTPGINEKSPTMRLEDAYTFTATPSSAGGTISWTVDESVNGKVTAGVYSATGTSATFDLGWDKGNTTYIIKAEDNGFADELEVQVFPPDKGISYQFENPYRSSPKIQVRVLVPSSLDPNTNVISVHHGSSRTNYFNYWTAWGKRVGWIILGPHFPDSGKWSGSRGYNLGNMFTGDDGKGNLNPEEQWSFRIAVDFARSFLEGFDLNDKTYDMWGHSAGGQFTHRTMLFIRDAPIRRGLPANPGWWTLPVYDEFERNYKYPYGPYHPKLDYDDADVARFTAMEGIIHAGNRDTQRGSSLRTTPEAEAQGRIRWLRANNMFDEVQQAEPNHNWDFFEVKGVGHDGQEMAKAAQQWLEDNPAGPPLPAVTVLASDASASEAGLDGGAFTVSRTGDASAALTVNYTAAGTAAAGSDYQPLSGVVTIPADQSSVEVVVTPIDDPDVESDETVSLVLSGDAAYRIGSPSNATVTIASDDVGSTLPVVSLSAVQDTASEAGLSPGRIRFLRTGDTGSALTVRYTVSGTAAAGSDYQPLSGVVTIPADQSSVEVVVTPIDDPDVESDETVSLALSADAAYEVGSPGNATVTIASDDVVGNLPVVSLSVVRDGASEASLSRGRYRIDRAGDLSAPLTVRYSLGGTATSGSDYRALSGSKTIKAGKRRAWFDIVPIDDGEVESDETVVVNLSADAFYQVGSPASGTVTIASDDVGGGLPQVTIAASDPTATEAGPTGGAFTVSRTGDSSAALTVNYSTGGTATSGADYAALGGSVTIAAGASSAVIGVDPVDDPDVEADETVVVNLSASSGYQLGTPNSATVTIASDDVGSNLPVVSITFLRDAAEAGRSRGRVRIERTGARGQGLTVRYGVGGTATSGADFTALSGEKKIKSGKDRNWIDIVPVNDKAAEGDESVVLTILPDPAYQVGGAGSITVTIADNDQNNRQANVR